SRVFGRALVSSAFCVEGGPAAADAQAAAALTARAAELADALDVDYVEFRGTARAVPAWACKDDLYAVFRRPLAADPERALAAIPRKQRAVVRQSLQAGLNATIDDDPADFFRAYSQNLRSLGTPAFPRRYFRELKERFGDACEILAVHRDRRVVAGLITFTFRGRVLPYYGGGTDEARDTGAYNFMYWDVMRRACLSGQREFDFGRSKRGTGAFAYKKNWGFEPQPLYHEYLVRRGAVPERHALNPRFQPFIALWKRLPLVVANGLGPLIVRNFG
ncbi:MAG TPA: FemAB family XrtA/PEP-CTERM system-associated protein, partial [Azospirillum sp.]